MLASPPERTDGKKAIAVVEDHPLMRRGLTVLIDAEPDLFVCAQATTCRGALQEIARRPPDLAIVDLALEGGDDGLDLVKALKIQYPTVPALVFSMHTEAIYGERAARRRAGLSDQAAGRRDGDRHPPHAQWRNLHERSARHRPGHAFHRPERP
jgi:chemotaxis response regulator CheB